MALQFGALLAHARGDRAWAVFRRIFLPRILAKQEEDGAFLWYGPVRITSVACMPELPSHYVLGFSFPRELAPREIEALGLTVPA